ncbi:MULTISPECIES: hypothetical protein [Aminobacterium]|jgi:hypothetical protein|uniref:Uncharacterized protein n=1 Tax=Aminobacterium colombiense (strain DSM 12261 / ALA-1) TaxID=572547 RepID=D5EH70_AMICL|nr:MULTISPECIES: hypothetical protein [Aminobacterium]MDD2379780.1 hypothetical protein [Aminobacterium colombiense]ADE57902.1 hypothetical protein Amico_1789 [Aminobacterium colombiense DSM 12261]MDD3767726.1 hypothetical protein [Aminobacterium colombiense]MDD4265945.1 hypothetical protein [Aminobacterium colombiense]MDD4585149.1 hypothetical protein [Aminobacterium colombiense]
MANRFFRWVGIVCLIFLFATAALAQSSVQPDEIELPESLKNSGKEVSAPISEDGASQSLPEGLRQEITYSDQGTPREVRHSFLHVEGNPVPDTFSYLEYKDSAWVFKSRTVPWGDDGYWTVKKRNTTEGQKIITDGIKQRGWYRGKVRLRGTPENWVYVEWKDGRGFVAPHRMEAFAGELDLPFLPRRKQAECRTT